MPNSYTCYLIGYIDKKTRKLVGAQFASESARSITCNSNMFPVDIFQMGGNSYSEAHDQMRKILQGDSRYFEWMRELVLGKPEEDSDG